jgi:RNA polymerase sigma factor (sigma-70 family)
MRRLIDSTDVLQEAMDAAFKAVHDPNAFNDEASFVAFLVVVSENCVRKHHRTQHTQGRDADRNEQCKVPDAASHAPGPLALAASADQWRQVLSELPPAHKAILRLLKAGRSHAEIMELLDVTDRMIQRVVKHARERFADETGK